MIPHFEIDGNVIPCHRIVAFIDDSETGKRIILDSGFQLTVNGEPAKKLRAAFLEYLKINNL